MATQSSTGFPDNLNWSETDLTTKSITTDDANVLNVTASESIILGQQQRVVAATGGDINSTVNVGGDTLGTVYHLSAGPNDGDDNLTVTTTMDFIAFNDLYLDLDGMNACDMFFHIKNSGEDAEYHVSTNCGDKRGVKVSVSNGIATGRITSLGSTTKIVEMNIGTATFIDNYYDR